MSSGRRRAKKILPAPTFSKNDVNVLSLKEFTPRMRTQTAETCSAHAFTALHEIATGRYYMVDDLVVHYMESLGSLMGEMSRNLARHGQRADGEPASQTASSRPRRGCRDRHQLETAEYRVSAKKAMQLLADSQPIAIQIRNFDTSSSAVRTTDIEMQDVHDGPVFHAVCVIGYILSGDVEGGGDFIFLNSFGEDWGEGGFGRISFAAFDSGRITEMYSLK